MVARDVPLEYKSIARVKSVFADQAPPPAAAMEDAPITQAEVPTPLIEEVEVITSALMLVSMQLMIFLCSRRHHQMSSMLQNRMLDLALSKCWTN